MNAEPVSPVTPAEFVGPLAAIAPTPVGDDAQVYVLDSQIGYDIDELIALWVAARTMNRLIVITSDETRGRRAALARLVLDLLGRPEVPVVAGSELPDSDTRFLFADYPLPVVPATYTDAAEVVAVHAEHAPTTVIGLGALTNIAAVLCLHPHLSEQIQIVLQGGWLDHYRKPDRASHNLHIDQTAAGITLRMAHRPRLVLSTHTNHDRLRLTPDSPLVTWFHTTDTPFAQLAATYCDRWFARRPHGSWQADSVAVAVALGARVAQFLTEPILTGPDARLYRHPTGKLLTVTTSIDHTSFDHWLARVIPQTRPDNPAAEAINGGDADR
ncbi:nucleoside hydrolase [Nocardia arthritidis]|uniref:Inosine/uridine-preferring nucleoside hydrolase domain-containing protein n=1 Tax=Nocardia arthritidis TaxID=228602 RepID=A0A6G9Y980_9NOCA|nr:nucleoside hydrolase [Nocardia arthritidis]QIS09825.1 hypothetical protein F5544_09625 [Nocardia arthritidis]